MKKLTLAATLAFAPTALFAQASAQAESKTTVSATSAAQGGSERRLSAEAQSSVDANIRVARERKLPEEPIRQRVAEGQAKGASGAQIAAASGKTLLDLQNSFDAMVRGGRANPNGDEVARGAQLIARGYTSTQIEAVTKQAPSDRSLVVAFETLTALQARGASTANAVAQIESGLAARASDAQLRQLAANANAAFGVNGELNAGGAAAAATGAASAAGSVGAASAPGSAAAGATAGVAGAVGGVLGKKP
ncbi:MAG: hypothetical protein JWL61_5515 [Gemmatimonadetes bacterium]|nr:hypothetical protein [Gemmatimonadota bacterium]